MEPRSPDYDGAAAPTGMPKAQGATVSPLVGVVGTTGAGKSSIINALLDQGTILPTSGWTAGTAVATEISYNGSDDPSQAYRAEIEFLSAADWISKLATLCRDVANDTTTTSNMRASWSKLRAVYPHLPGAAFRHTTVEDLAGTPFVSERLGTTKRIAEATLKAFHDKLQQHVSTDWAKLGARQLKPGEPRSWPLIKVVRVFVKADALSTGTTLVDLPGARNLDPAYADVMGTYLDKCTHLWIVVPVDRATTETSAWELFAEAIRRRGTSPDACARIAFVCSKTDNVLLPQIIDDLGSSDEAVTLQLQKHSQEVTALYETFKAQEAECYHFLDDQPGYDQLTLHELERSVAQRCDLLRDVKGTARALHEAAESTHQQMKALVETIVHGRDSFVKMGICYRITEEIMQYNEHVAKHGLRKPAKPARLADIAGSLPIFFVSSAAYHKVCGHSKFDTFRAKGLFDIEQRSVLEQTGIPELRQHTKCLGEPTQL